MAADVTYRPSESLPKQFCPSRPEVYDYDKWGNSGQKAVAGGRGTLVDEDPEPVPMSQRITPVIYNRRDLTSLTDPDLCVTPEKRTPLRKQCSKKSTNQGAKRVGSGELKTSKVRFDQVVTVKHLSPDEAESRDIINIDRSGDTSHELSFRFDDEDPFTKHFESANVCGEDIFPRTQYSLRGESSDYEDPLLPDAFSIGSTSDYLHEQLISSNTASSNPHNVMRQKVAKRSPDKQQQEVADCTEFAGADSIIEVKAQKMAPAKMLFLERREAGEHELAHPEFNSTLLVGKEVEEVKNEEVDLLSAVAERLKKSNKARTKFEENTYAVLNRGGTQFPEVFSVDVQEDDLIELAAQERGTRGLSGHRHKPFKPEDQLSRVPDIIDFFTPDLQRELPSFALPHIEVPSNRLVTADQLSAFDTYSHIRAWEER